MTPGDFLSTLKKDKPPENIGPLLLALWYDAKGDWQTSHNIAQEIESTNGALLHAYLHRKEGDTWNADYWYRTAGVKTKDISLEEEWKTLVDKFMI
jgi:hypothetical protein